MQRARNLESVLAPAAPRIYLKRDDLTGLAFGGNKARKLEYLLADAVAADATILVTEGAAQSNHARITAAAARIAGMKALLVLDERHGAVVAGNLLLDHLMGAEIRIVPDKPARAHLMAAIGDELRDAGERPYVIPTGGSVPLGAAAYVAMVAELTGQLLAIGEAPRRLYLATGSQGTQAGVVVGARAFSAPFAVRGIAVERPVEKLRRDCAELANGTAALIGLDARFTPDEIAIDDGYVGVAYGVATPEGLAAIRLLARTEAVFLDPVYSGKAMAALLADIRSGEIGQDEAVVFLHTGGGPSLFPFGASLLATADA